jgi:tetratricopeptide (TPR) repeat protein
MNASQPSPPTSAPAKETSDTATLLESILRSADAHYAREDWVAARDSLSLAVQLAPDQGQIHAALGSLQYRLQDYPAACASFKTATSKSQENADLHTQLAMVQIQLKQVDEAKAALQQALKLCPNNPTARQMLGDLDFEAKRYADAAQQYCALLGSNPDGVSLLLHLGKCLYELRDLASARWCFERVIALEPSNAIAAEALQILTANPVGVPTACASAQ